MRRMFSFKQLEEIADRRVQAVASSGELENVKVFENIVDKDGHKRFVEGDIELEEGTNLTLSYGKWALSGSHLLIVVAGNVENGAEIPSGTIAKIDLPEWVKDKIVPVASTIVESKTSPFYDSSLTAQNAVNFLEKYPTKQVSIYLIGFTANANRSFRLSFDLLIDNE